jgi:hypothetical protein
MRTPLLGQWKAIKGRWPALTLYHRFQSTVALMRILSIEQDDRLLCAKSETIGEGGWAAANELPSLAKMRTASWAVEKTTTT